MSAGKFITLEGGEGAGKSTQAAMLARRLEDRGYETVLTREPGGSQKAEAIREFLLSGDARPYGPLAEAILFGVARDDHLKKRILPAMKGGKWVICDRFADSTRAYQGAAGLDPNLIRALERLFVGAHWPHLTVILDLPAEAGLARARSRGNGAGNGAEPDRFESMEVDYHASLRDRFRAIADREAERCVLIDADRPQETVSEAIWDAVVERLSP